MTPEFSRAERIDAIGEQARTIEIAADADERRRLARRFGLDAVERLEARFELVRDAAGIVARGRVEAAVVQLCSVTGDPLPAQVGEDVALRFVPAADAGAEVELSPDALDTMEVEDGAVDLGEAAAETMALALDPFPRSPAAADALRDAGVVGEDEVGIGAFAALTGLRDRLDR